MRTSVSFPGGKAAGGVALTTPPQSSAEVKERVLRGYLYSSPSLHGRFTELYRLTVVLYVVWRRLLRNTT